MSITVRPLTATEGPLATALTFPGYRHMLALEPVARHAENPSVIVQPLAIGALNEAGALVGLALIELPTMEGAHPELLSIYVAAEYRRRGIAHDLLAVAESCVKEAGHEGLLVVYMSGGAGIEALEGLLAKREWHPPRVRMVSVRFTSESIVHAPWLGKYKYPEGYELFPWTELTKADKEHIYLTQQESGWITPNLVPWRHDEGGFEPVTSVGIRFKGDVVGWVINHMVEPDVLRWTCSFIRHDLSRLGRILPAYTYVVDKLPEVGSPTCSFTTPLFHEGMVRFAKKWIGPWGTYVGESRQSHIRFSGEGSDDDFGISQPIALRPRRRL